MAEWTAAQDWESAALVAAALETGPDRRVLLPMGAGDTALGLALTGSEVVAAAPQAWSRALWSLKAAGRHLERLEHLQLFGLESAGRRVFLYHRVRSALPDEARAFWDAHEEAIRVGVLTQGKVEQTLARMRAQVPLAHRRQTALALLATEGAARERFVRRRWQGARWSAWVAMTARQLQPVLRSTPGHRWLLQRLERVLVHGPSANGFLECALLGLPRSAEGLPPCLHPLGHAQLSAVKRVEVRREGLVELAGGGGFDAVHLGSSAVPPGLARALRPGGRVTRWCLPDDIPAIEGLELVSASFAPEADPVGVRGDLAVWVSPSSPASGR